MSSPQLSAAAGEGDEFGDGEVSESSERDEQAEVAVARPPVSAAPSLELVVSGQAALDYLEQVLAPCEPSSVIRRYISCSAADWWVERRHLICAGSTFC